MKEITAIIELAEKWYPAKKLKHALRVANYAAASANSTNSVYEKDAFIVGLAHDLLEDTECPYIELKDAIGEELYIDVEILTKEENETYTEYIERVIAEGSDTALLVKRADMKDHMTLTDTLTDKLKDKYIPVLHYFL